MGARVARARATAVFVGSEHIREVLEDVVGHVDRVHEVPPGVDVDEFRPLPREEALARLLEEARRDPPNPGNANERLPDEGNAERFAAFFARAGPDRRLLRQADLQQGRPPAARGARRARREGGDRRLRRLPRGARGARAGAHAVHRRARAPASRRAAAAVRRRGRAVDLPRGVRHGRGRGRRRGRRRRSSRATPASPRSPKGSRPSTRPSARRSTSFANGDVAELRDKLAALLALPDDGARASSARRRGARSSTRWSWASVAERLLAPVT